MVVGGTVVVVVLVVVVVSVVVDVDTVDGAATGVEPPQAARVTRTTVIAERRSKDDETMSAKLANKRAATPLPYDADVGLFSGFKRRRAEKEAAEQRVLQQSALQEWQAKSDRLDVYIDAVERCISGDTAELFSGDDGGFILKGDEFAIGCVQNSALLETVRGPSTYQGGYGGVSFPLFAGIRLNTGGVKGKRIPGEEKLTVVDQGDTLITNKRAVFRGATNNLEWPFARLSACEHNADGWSTFAVSGRKKNSGFAYGDDVAAEVQFRLELGIALCNETLDRLLAELRVERQHLDTQRP